MVDNGHGHGDDAGRRRKGKATEGVHRLPIAGKLHSHCFRASSRASGRWTRRMRYQIAALLRQFGHVPARGARENACLARSDIDPKMYYFNSRLLILMTMAMLIDSEYMCSRGRRLQCMAEDC